MEFIGLTAAQLIILGIIQGIVEWLPISSEGALILFTNLFQQLSLETIIRIALFLHLGTFFAALIYFRKDVSKLFLTLFKKTDLETRRIFKFLLMTTIISGILGFLLLKGLIFFEKQFLFSGIVITFLIGFLLLVTGIFQLKTRKNGFRNPTHIRYNDTLLLGILQGLAVLPGLSRSGLTVSGLLLKKFDKTQALRLSFLMSLPIVLFGNILLNIEYFVFSSKLFFGLITSFIFGLATIHLLIKLSEKINFGYFVLLFGILVLIAGALMFIA